MSSVQALSDVGAQPMSTWWFVNIDIPSEIACVDRAGRSDKMATDIRERLTTYWHESDINWLDF